jgi:hypothetical protein
MRPHPWRRPTAAKIPLGIAQIRRRHAPDLVLRLRGDALCESGIVEVVFPLSHSLSFPGVARFAPPREFFSLGLHLSDPATAPFCQHGQDACFTFGGFGTGRQAPVQTAALFSLDRPAPAPSELAVELGATSLSVLTPRVRLAQKFVPLAHDVNLIFFGDSSCMGAMRTR